MLVRLTHAAIAFAVTVVVYQAYVLLAVPFIEPSLAPSANPAAASTDQQRSEARRAVHKYRELLAAYFPPDHWSLQQPPITSEIGQAMIVLDDYHPRDNGQIRVDRCAIIFFPHVRVRGQPPPRDAIILEAPHGAVLQMDEGFRPGLGGLGRIQWAKLLGEIVVRSDMREPGPQDDLRITTRDLYMNEDLIRTDSQVEMRLGPHRGRGRVLEIRLVAVEQAEASETGPSIGGIDSVEILHDVEAQLASGSMGLSEDSSLPKQEGNSKLVAPPINITSQGRFRFDFANFVASFFDQVQVLQVHAAGQRDQLLCEELNLYFARAQDTVERDESGAAGLAAAVANSSELGELQPAVVEARGTEKSPVVLDSPSQRIAARCERLRVELGPRRVTLDGRDEVTFSYRGSEVHAPMVRYQAPPQGSGQRVGTLLAAGNGWLRARASDDQSQEPLEARWTQSMRLQRLKGQPVLSLHGRPRLTRVGMGQLWADELYVYLRERTAEGAESDALPADVVVDRMLARGRIAIDSAQLSGQVQQLAVWVNYVPNHLALARPDGNNPAAVRRSLGVRPGRQSRTYHIDGEKLTVQLTVRDRQTEVTSLAVEGAVVFRESSTTGKASQPLLVKAQQLRVENADTPSAKIQLRGQPATITAAGMTIRAASLRLNRGASRAWIDSPGELELPVDRDLSGKPLANPQPMAIHWQAGMELDQDRITFRRGVRVRTNGGALQTERLVVQLAAPVLFDGAARQGRLQIAQLECWEGVTAQFEQRDAAGLTSVEQMQMESFVANQQTGDLRGVGPGWLESTHLASGSNPLSSLAGGKPSPSVQRLRFLRVDFRRGVRGNLHRRQVEVFGNVRAVYGPVDSWEQKLEMSIRGTPGPDTVWITSDQLGIAESPLARLNPSQSFGPVELYATGRVTIEGRAGERGMFTARAHRATYDQQKTLFVLEGDGRMPATLTHQPYVGAPFSEQSARKLTYIQSTGEVKVEGIVKGEWNQLNLGRPTNAPGQPTSR